MKKIILTMCLLGFSFIVKLNFVKAKDVFYINQNSVSFNEVQYNYFSKMFWDGYQDLVTQDEFDYIARLSGVSLTKVGNAYVMGDNFNKSYSSPDIKSNGFGYSVKLENVSNLKVNVSFFTTTGGTIYGAYEHSRKNISLKTSKLYTLSQGGQGNVFKFTGAASSAYDEANGFNLNV